VAALLAFLEAGHTATTGAFRSHVGRLARFLESLALDAGERCLVEKALALLTGGTVPQGKWPAAARAKSGDWKAVRTALG
jgi:hypothetical protein